MHWGGGARDGRPPTDSHTDIVLTLLQIRSLNLLVSGSMDGTIRLWNTATGKPGRVLRGHHKGVRALAYNEEYRFLVSAGFDYEAIVRSAAGPGRHRGTGRGLCGGCERG